MSDALSDTENARIPNRRYGKDDRCKLAPTEEKLNNKIAIVVKNRKIDPNNERALANLHDQFIMELERDLGLKFKVVKIRVAPPPPPFGRDYPIKAIGAPLCCVARETNCISIVSVKNEQR